MHDCTSSACETDTGSADELGRVVEFPRNRDCAYLLTYHIGNSYGCENATEEQMKRDAGEVVRRYEAVTDLAHLNESSLVTEKMLGVDLRAISQDNSRKVKGERPPLQAMGKLIKYTRYEVVLHSAIFRHLALMYGASNGKRCYVEKVDDVTPWLGSSKTGLESV